MLVAAAAVPYQFDSAQRMSFYVGVRTETGDRTVWGSDLERALAGSASQPRIGDQVVLTRHGAFPVKVLVTRRNAQGELTGEKRIVKQRAVWRIETPDYLRAMEERAMRIRSGETVSPEIRRQHPQLDAAAAGLALAEQYATRVTSDRDCQQRLVRLIRERIADALAQGHSIHLTDRRPHRTPGHVRQRTARDRGAPNRERSCRGPTPSNGRQGEASSSSEKNTQVCEGVSMPFLAKSAAPATAWSFSDGSLEALKRVGLVFMTGDHVNKHLLQDASPTFYALGRMVMPLFGFVLMANPARPGAFVPACICAS